MLGAEEASATLTNKVVHQSEVVGKTLRNTNQLLKMDVGGQENERK